MFEFHMSYLDPQYHKPGDKPFIFPPDGVNSKVNANIVEIRGRIGSGKTTLLNTLALALGFLDREKALDNKPTLRHKLESLRDNSSLEYDFMLSCDKPERMELRLERKQGQPPRRFLNSQPLGPDNLAQLFDIVFLTEDDPRKVITVSKEKVANYFSDLQKRLAKLNSVIADRKIELERYASSKDREKKLLDDINNEKSKLEGFDAKSSELRKQLDAVNKKAELEKAIELLNNQENIESEYKRLDAQLGKLVKREDKEIVQKTKKARIELDNLEDHMKRIEKDIYTTCTHLGLNNIKLDPKRLLAGDWTEYNEIMRTRGDEDKNVAVKLELVDKMIQLFGDYPQDEIVPVVNRTVKEVLGELMRLKIGMSQNRGLALLKGLESHLEDRDKTAKAIDREQRKIAELKQQLSDRQGIEDLQMSFHEAEKRYFALVEARKMEPEELRSQYRIFSSFKGDPETIKNDLDALSTDLKVAKTLKSKSEEDLRLLHEKMVKPPAFENRKEDLESLVRKISDMIERLVFWEKILRDPPLKRDSLSEASKSASPVYTRESYDSFVEIIGEFLGTLFEPIPFDDSFHPVDFYDIVKEVFITKDRRGIKIENLSQGQNKVTALTGSLKKMNPSKKGIVLVDEIAELDLESLGKVVGDLKSKQNDGSLLLALLVRPADRIGPRVEVEGLG